MAMKNAFALCALLACFAGCGEPSVDTPAPTVNAAKPDDTASQNKAVGAKMVSAINAQNIQDFAAVLDAKFVDHSAAPGYTPDKDGTVKMFADFFAGFPDIHCDVERAVAEGDTVVMKWTTIATNTAPFMGAPPSNTPVLGEVSC